MLTDEEQRFLSVQSLGRLATVGPGGAPQVKPVGFSYNEQLGTIDIGGYNMAQSAKYKNVKRNPAVAFVVDDRPDGGLEGTRFLEIRGVAEAVPGDGSPAAAGSPGLVMGPEIIRIHPRRVLSYNINPAHPGFQARGTVSGHGEVGGSGEPGEAGEASRTDAARLPEAG
jgi:pyridoxamine 5'-phosphate oxidase family protein